MLGWIPTGVPLFSCVGQVNVSGANIIARRFLNSRSAGASGGGEVDDDVDVDVAVAVADACVGSGG
jgi:hypothetical protein